MEFDLIFRILDRPTVCTLAYVCRVSMPRQKAWDISVLYKAQVFLMRYFSLERLIRQIRFKDIANGAVVVHLLPLGIAIAQE